MDENRQAFITYLNGIYDQANEHLREQEHKRDQVVTFYAVLLSFFVTTSGQIEKNFGGSFAMLLLSIGIFFIGIVVARTIADLRGWHKQYLDAIYVLNYAFAHLDSYPSNAALATMIEQLLTYDQTAKNPKKESDTEVKPKPLKKTASDKQVKTRSESDTKDKWMDNLDRRIGSTEDGMFYGVLMFSMASLFLVGKYLSSLLLQYWPRPLPQDLDLYLYGIESLVGIIILFTYARWMSHVLKKKSHDANIYKTWILDFHYYSAGQQVNEATNYYEFTVPDGYPHLTQKTGGVIVIPKLSDKYMLIWIKRDQDMYLEFPRGFVEPEEVTTDKPDFIHAAHRELTEEVGIKPSNIRNSKDLGEVKPDSGLISSKIHAVLLDISPTSTNYVFLQKSEGISDCALFTPQELRHAITEGKIVDGFTLSAITLGRLL